jgi:hypothetical protein
LNIRVRLRRFRERHQCLRLYWSASPTRLKSFARKQSLCRGITARKKSPGSTTTGSLSEAKCSRSYAMVVYKFRRLLAVRHRGIAFAGPRFSASRTTRLSSSRMLSVFVSRQGVPEGPLLITWPNANRTRRCRRLAITIPITKRVLSQSRVSRMVPSEIVDFTWRSRRVVRGLGKANP